MKATDGLSDLAKQILALAGHQLSKETQRKLWDLRPPATQEEVLAMIEQVKKEREAAKRTEAAREAARLKRLKKLNEENPEE